MSPRMEVDLIIRQIVMGIWYNLPDLLKRKSHLTGEQVLTILADPRVAEVWS